MCKKDKQNDLFLRFWAESQYHQYSSFWTFTYDEEHLPRSFNGLPTLRQQDFSLFMKRLRKKIAPYIKNIKVFYVGEYGGVTNRPHYHALFFGVPKEFSSYVLDSWKNGFITVSDVNPARFRYVAKYVMKNEVFSEDFCRENGIEPQFSQCSRRPGLGLKYIEENYLSLIYRGYFLYKGIRYSLPRYFFNKIKDFDNFYNYKLSAICFKELVSDIKYSELTFFKENYEESCIKYNQYKLNCLSKYSMKGL